MKTADPYLYFNGNTEEAFTFYKKVLKVDITDVLRYGDIDGNPMGVPEKDLHKIAHIGLPRSWSWSWSMNISTIN